MVECRSIELIRCEQHRFLYLGERRHRAPVRRTELPHQPHAQCEITGEILKIDNSPAFS